MFKKPTKKQFLIRRIAISVLATISVLIIATFSILFILGYRLDSGNGRLEQGALLQFNSNPTGAQVWIDGAYIGSQTATKQTVIAGNHSIRMVRNGYEDWNRTLSLDAGTLTWLDYARLVPSERPVQSVLSYATLAELKFSPDLKSALALQNRESPTFELIDLRAQEVKTSTITLSGQTYTDATTADVSHVFSINKWSTGGRYVIIKHTYNDTVEWIMLDTQDANRSVNITTELNVDLADVKFASNNGTGLYGLTTEGVVRKLDISGGTISRGLITHVQRFSVFEESSVVSYVGQDPTDAASKVVGIYRDGDSASRVLRSSSDPNTTFNIATTRYYGDDYVAIAQNTQVSILAGSLPSASSQDASSLRPLATLDLTGNTTALSFSAKGDYLLAQSNAQFTSYELEHARSETGVVAVAEGQGASRLKWLDNAHIWNDDNGSLIMRDFNGINAHSIMSVASGFDASLSPNGRYFYAVGVKNDGTYQLQRVRMILE